jgi:hypothetical protein
MHWIATICVIIVIIVVGLVFWSGKDSKEIRSAENLNNTQSGISSLQLYQPGIEPDGIAPNLPTDVTFSVLLTGVKTHPNSLRLERIERVGELKDNGQDADLVAQDYVYTGNFQIEAKAEQRLYYRVIAEYQGKEYVSPVSSLLVTGFPIGPARSDPNYLVEDQKTGQRFYSNEVLLSFIEGTTNARIREIVNSINATIVGTIPSLGVFELRIEGDGSVKGVYDVIKFLETYKEVLYAEPNYVTDINEDQ